MWGLHIIRSPSAFSFGLEWICDDAMFLTFQPPLRNLLWLADAQDQRVLLKNLQRQR